MGLDPSAFAYQVIAPRMLIGIRLRKLLVTNLFLVVHILFHWNFKTNIL